MQKYIFNTTIYLLITGTSFSQKRDNIFSISFGASFPAGGYGNTDINNDNAGFAKIGEHIDFSFEHSINATFAISVMLYGQRNPDNTRSLENQFSNRLYPVGFNPTQLVSFPNWKFDKKTWLYAGLLFGGANEFPLNKRKNDLYIKLKSLIGIVYASSLKLNGSSTTSTTLANVTQSGNSGLGFSYLFSGGLKYNFNRKYCLLFDINYLGTSQIKFKDISNTFTGVINSGSPNAQAWQSMTTSDVKQGITTININLGIGIKI